MSEAGKAGAAADNADERQFVATRLAERDEAGAAGTIKIGIFFNVCVLGVTPFMAPRAYLRAVLAAAALAFVVDVVWTLFPRARVLRAIDVIFIFNQALAGTFTFALAMAMRTEDPLVLVAGSGAVMALTVVLLLEAPFSKGRAPLMGLTFWLWAIIFVPWNAIGLRWLGIYTVMITFGVIVRNKTVAALKRELRLEFHALETERRIAMAKVGRELELAREIQDSMAPAADYQTENLHVQCFSCKYEAVGGDWLTARTWRDGTFVMVVADATGKGMQAALVVHAIQSLWATALDLETFDPEAWLQQVNRALYRLGERQPHTATLGLATLKGNRLAYWGAGHLPLFVLLGEEGRVQRVLPSRGGVLGLSASVRVFRRHIDVLPTFPLRALLCSDGVLPRGSLTRPGDILELYDGVTSAGSGYLGTLPAKDDKSLIMVERAVHIKQAPTPQAM